MTISPEDVARGLLAHRWTFAKTMPTNPHEYTLRKGWDDREFAAVVRYIREHGYRYRWGGRDYVCLDVGEHMHWTQGNPIDETTLINRKPLTAKHRAAPIDALQLPLELTP